ncbi:hypothetical protein CWI38_1804p0010 [Hamiltosporidium tvaerminnensis]|uniref:Uncharacterized protein n=1 Tax=Hamiltosporidium tvaerminnensis TaxID=1176355 RepID=A0A4Q9LRT3_9MICR|nr:hypothetical protein CWI38_1804p0010 [Hamiltosporidium tvaerminnensis]
MPNCRKLFSETKKIMFEYKNNYENSPLEHLNCVKEIKIKIIQLKKLLRKIERCKVKSTKVLNKLSEVIKEEEIVDLYKNYHIFDIDDLF